MKKLLILSLLFYSAAFAQKKQEIHFLKNNGREVQEKDSADFIRVLEEPDPGNSYYNLYEYYPDSKTKLLGRVSSLSPFLVYEGRILTWYPNGNQKDIINYEKGTRKGEASFYYSNGQLRETMEIIPGSGRPNSPGYVEEKQKLISYFDSTGVQKVKDGNGVVRREYPEQKAAETGAYENGYKTGTWIGTLYGGSYEEEYKEGTFIKGIATTKNGEKLEYTTPEQMPDFKGGMQMFYRFVSQNFTYPKAARANGVSGRLILTFVVEKDGSLQNIKVLRDLGYGTGEEAVKMLKKCPDWKPGLQHGIPVRVQYTIPIVLNLEAQQPPPVSGTIRTFGRPIKD